MSLSKLPSKTTVIWAFRAVFLGTAIAGVYFLGGGLWFFAGMGLGWLGAVLEVAAMQAKETA